MTCRRFARRLASPRAGSSSAASWSPAARPSAPTTFSTTSRTSPSPSSRPRTTTTASATACSRRWSTPTTLDIPFVFSSNGDGFLFHDRTGQERGKRKPNLSLDAFPSPADLWAQYRAWKGLTPEAGSRSSSRTTSTTAAARSPRYYQRIAINKAIEAIAKGQDRILLVMATGTGKTYTAFQIIWRLWKAGRKKRILFPRRPQRPGRPDDGERLPPLRRGHGQAQHQLEDHRARGRHRG